MPRVKMPNGVVVDMPDTLTPELATRLKALQSSTAAAPEPAAPKRTAGESFGLGVRDVLSGAGGIVNAPFEAVGGFAKGAAELAGYPQAGAAINKAVVPPNLGTMASNTMGLPTPQGEREKTQSAIQQGVVGLAAPMMNAGTVNAAMAVPKLAGKAAQALTPKVAPELAELAQKAQAAGIPLRPDMLGNSRIMKMVGDTLEKVPLSGDMGTKRQVAFNQAVIDTIGGDTTATKLTPDIYKKAMSTTGEAIGNMAAKYPVPVEGPLKAGLQATLKSAEFETDATGRILKRYVDEIASKAKDGKIDGTAFRKIRTQLTGQMRRTTDGDLKHALSNLDEVMLDSVKAQMTPEEISSFSDLRRKYSNGKALEPLVAKGEGDISASKLMARMTATGSGKAAMAKGTGGDLGDIARIGQKFLSEPPTPKNTAYGVLGEIGAGAVAPGTTASLVGGANLYNRFAPKIAKGMIERSKLKPPVQP